jgi:NTP pyrophosphatase (non-canonical NTP hydrolase)
MELNEFQDQANVRDQFKDDQTNGMTIRAVLALVSRTGALTLEFLRHERDGAGYEAFDQNTIEILGDLLWYISNIARRCNITLEEIATENLAKIENRWGRGRLCDADEGYLVTERFPRKFEITVSAGQGKAMRSTLTLTYLGKPFGDPLTDNAHDDDGYRFHDVFHLAFVCHLGWSPVLRGAKFFNCKRRSKEDTDHVEDGGRAGVIDEAIAALIFNEAKDKNFYDGMKTVSMQQLRLIQQLTAHLEVSRCSMGQWEAAILNAFEVWRQARENPEGLLIGDLEAQLLSYVPHSKATAPNLPV